MPKEEKPITEIIERLREDYYIHDFNVTEDGLKATDIDRIYKPHEITVDKMFRFEGTSDPADMSIIYAVSTEDGEKGIIINAFGTYGDSGIDEFMKSVKYPAENNG